MDIRLPLFFNINEENRITRLEKKAKEIIDALSSGPVQQYILDNENSDVRDIVLKNKLILGIPTAQLFDQITTRKKAKDKLPLFYRTPGIIFAPPENFEQSSSEMTAIYKSEILRRIINKGRYKGADLTGGFGVDTYFLSKNAETIHYVEPQQSLLEIAQYNHQLLGAKNIMYHSSTAEDFVATTEESFDFIYADPSRRSGSKKKIHTLEDSQPDVLKIKSTIFQKTNILLVKASPLLDIQAGCSQLECVRKVFVVSVSNECKELLFLCEKLFAGGSTVEAINITGDDVFDTFEFSFEEEREENISFSDPLAYLYEPNASILKAGAFKTVGTRFGLKKIQASTHLYTSDTFVESFPGRRFLVESYIKPDPSEVKNYFPDGKANVTTRNYPLTPDALKKKTGLKDGGEKFLIGFSGQRKKYLAVAKRL